MILVTDRTQADVNYADANRDSEIPLKGAYSAADFNRVGVALNYISDTLFGFGYGLNPQLRTDWKVTENMSLQDATKYLETVREIKKSYFVFPETLPLPDHIHDLFRIGGHEYANNIEKLFIDIETIIPWMVDSFIYSNQFYSGEHVDIAGMRFASGMTWAEFQTLTLAKVETLRWEQIDISMRRPRTMKWAELHKMTLAELETHRWKQIDMKVGG